MKGLVRTHHLVSCAPTIVRCFGLRSYVRCVVKTIFSHEPVTFLQCVAIEPSRTHPAACAHP
jgi:hypothetical protein